MEGTRRRSVFTSRLVSSTGRGEQPHVADDLRRAILSGDEPPGTVIPIEAVAQFFGVSQIPVREALKVLLGEGLIEHVPHVGYSVAKLTFAEFREMYDVRQALEAAALRAAAGRATAADEDVVRARHGDMAAALAAGDGGAYSRASRAFHLALIRPSGMQRLLHLYEGAWNMTEAARPMARVDTAHRAHLHDDHEGLLAAFAARDADRLVAESTRHYDHLKASLDTFRDDVDVFRLPD